MRESLHRVWVVSALVLGCVTGCGFGSLSEPVTPGAGQVTRCSIGASQTSVLVTEWPAAEKANLEGLARGGAVAVEFTGCELKLLTECRLPGNYTWQRTTPGSDVIEITNEAELYAKLPLGAVSLAGELQRSGRLSIETTVSGQLRLQDMTAAQVTMAPECARATHLVEGVSLGAFVTQATQRSLAGANASTSSVGLGGQQEQRENVVRTAGDKSACLESNAEAPAPNCASPIQVFLLPIPGRTETAGPPGTVRVDFVSSEPSVRWDVFVNDEATCTTPCAHWVDPARPLELRTREQGVVGMAGMAGGFDKVKLQRLETGQMPAQVIATPTSGGQFVTGITFTALGGMALITGAVLTPIGCSADEGERRAGLCTSGLITASAGALVAGGAIWMIVDSLATVRVQPFFDHAGGQLSLRGGSFAGQF